MRVTSPAERPRVRVDPHCESTGRRGPNPAQSCSCDSARNAAHTHGVGLVGCQLGAPVVPLPDAHNVTAVHVPGEVVRAVPVSEQFESGGDTTSPVHVSVNSRHADRLARRRCARSGIHSFGG
jgi:hypothetical protein